MLTTIEDRESTMQCFDLEDTLFVRNKWDCVNVGRQKRDEIKMTLTDRMRAEFPWVSKNRIFDICLRKVGRNSTSIDFFSSIFIFHGNTFSIIYDIFF